MAITLDEVRYIAKLAHLDFTGEELERFTRQLSAILDYVTQLDRLDTSAVEPTAHASGDAGAPREDEPRPTLPAEAALGNAPEAAEGLFRVPRVIG